MKQYLRERVVAAFRDIGIDPASPVSFETPRQEGHGDLTTNAAMVAARKAGKNPRELAAALVAGLHLDPSLVASTEVAGPGFINFTFAATYIWNNCAR